MSYTTNRWVLPYIIDELGTVGLYLHDIAYAKKSKHNMKLFYDTETILKSDRYKAMAGVRHVECCYNGQKDFALNMPAVEFFLNGSSNPDLKDFRARIHEYLPELVKKYGNKVESIQFNNSESFEGTKSENVEKEVPMTEVIDVKNFVKPVPHPALDNEVGLTVHQIASSLGVRSNDVKRKLEDRGMIQRIKNQGFQVATIVATVDSGTYVERDVESFVLDVNAAKFFVSKYDNDIGDAYLALLIRLEAKVNEAKKAMEAMDPEDALIASIQLGQKLRKEAAAEKALNAARDFENKQKHAQLESQLNQVNQSLPQQVKNTVVEMAKSIDKAPTGYILGWKIAKEYFFGLSKSKISAFLNSIGHPKVEIPMTTDDGIPCIGFCFKEAGLSGIAGAFYNDLQFIRECPKVVQFLHPAIGLLQPKKEKMNAALVALMRKN